MQVHRAMRCLDKQHLLPGDVLERVLQQLLDVLNRHV